MNGTIELTPDQLAQLVAAVFEANGFKAYGLALHDAQGQLVGYQRAVVHYEAAAAIKVFPAPKMTRDDLDRILHPNAGQPAFSREPAGGVAVG